MIKIADELTNEYVLDWLHHQTWTRQEWNGNAFEMIPITELHKQSWIMAFTVHRVLQSGPIDYNGYQYKLGLMGAQVHRWSEKIRKPTENKVSYTVRKITEVLQ
jgi:hypothetical protein